MRATNGPRAPELRGIIGDDLVIDLFAGGGGASEGIEDIRLRMLRARELYRAQGFDDGYEIAPMFRGKPLTQSEQIAKAGNSVCPPVARALVAANFAR